MPAESVQYDFNRKDDWFGEDKAKHLIGSLILTGAVSYYQKRHQAWSDENSVVFGAVVTFSLGIAKEIRDDRLPNRRFSWKDMTANILGIGLGVVLLSQW